MNNKLPLKMNTRITYSKLKCFVNDNQKMTFFLAEKTLEI